MFTRPGNKTARLWEPRQEKDCGKDALFSGALKATLLPSRTSKPDVAPSHLGPFQSRAESTLKCAPEVWGQWSVR